MRQSSAAILLGLSAENVAKSILFNYATFGVVYWQALAKDNLLHTLVFRLTAAFKSPRCKQYMRNGYQAIFMNQDLNIV